MMKSPCCGVDFPKKSKPMILQDYAMDHKEFKKKTPQKWGEDTWLSAMYFVRRGSVPRQTNPSHWNSKQILEIWWITLSRGREGYRKKCILLFPFKCQGDFPTVWNLNLPFHTVVQPFIRDGQSRRFWRIISHFADTS